MVPRYCFRGLFRKSKYKIERQDRHCDSRWAGGRGKGGFMTSGREQDVTLFSIPLPLLWVSFCAMVWLGLCILHFWFVSELEESVSGALENLWRGIKLMEWVFGNFEASPFITGILVELPEPEGVSCARCLLYCYHLACQLQVRKLFFLSNSSKKFSTLYSWRKKICSEASVWFCHVLQCGQDYALTSWSVFIERI